MGFWESCGGVYKQHNCFALKTLCSLLYSCKWGGHRAELGVENDEIVIINIIIIIIIIIIINIIIINIIIIIIIIIIIHIIIIIIIIIIIVSIVSMN